VGRLDTEEGQHLSDKKDVLQERFEQCLLDGLKGQPLVNKDGPVLDKESGEILMVAPDSSFLSVVRAYLKDLSDKLGKPKTPETGKSKGMLAAFESKLPFNSTRPN
jgi:hypothetical protein